MEEISEFIINRRIRIRTYGGVRRRRRKPPLTQFLRQNVQRALNRGESYHQLRRAISYANFGKLKFKTEEEQQLWNECSRLISSAVIFHNESIFSNLLEAKTLNLDMIKSISPVAWQHINFFGRYEFSKKPDPLDLEIIVKPVKKPKSL